MPYFLQKRGGWPYIHRLMSLVGIVFVVLAVFQDFTGRLEGKVHPVAIDFAITQVEAVSDDQGVGTLISGSFTVLRDECDFAGLNWQLVGENHATSIDVVFLPGARVHPEGPSEFGPWRLSIPPSQLEQTRVEALHNCPWRPWLVATYLWP